MMEPKTPETATKRDKSRQRILAYAQRVFFERGFRNVTVEQLCSEMGMSKRTFYKHFANLEALVEAMVTEQAMKVSGIILENLDRDAPLQEILRQHFRLVHEHFASRISLPMIADVQAMMPELWAGIEQFRHFMADRISALVERGQRTGEVRPEIDARIVGTILHLIFTHVAQPNVLLSSGLSISQIATTLETIFTKGLLLSKKQGGKK